MRLYQESVAEVGDGNFCSVTQLMHATVVGSHRSLDAAEVGDGNENPVKSG